MAPPAQLRHVRTAGVFVQHPVAVGHGAVVHLLGEQGRGAVGVGLRVVGLQPNGVVEVGERPRPVVHPKEGLRPSAVRRRHVGPQANSAGEALDGLGELAGVEGGVPAVEQVAGVGGVPVGGHGGLPVGRVERCLPSF